MHLNDHCTSAQYNILAANDYKFSLSQDDCIHCCCCCCLFVVDGSDVAMSKPRIFSTCADCLRRMMLRGVLESRGGTKLRGASGDLWLAELDPNTLLLAGLTAYDTGLLLDNLSPAAAVWLTAVKKKTLNSTYKIHFLLITSRHHMNKC